MNMNYMKNQFINIIFLLFVAFTSCEKDDQKNNMINYDTYIGYLESVHKVAHFELLQLQSHFF